MEIFRQMQPLADDRAGNWPGAAAHRRGTRRPKPETLAVATAEEPREPDEEHREAPADE